jgi:hypothetical protein
MRLTAYPIVDDPPALRPAALRRPWMDATHDSRAYHCLPLIIANTCGWELVSPVAFEAEWTGATDPSGVRITVEPSASAWRPSSSVGDGVMTMHPGYLIRSEQPYSLFVMGPANSPKDGLTPLTAIVETYWLPGPFSMNWAFTRKNTPVHFAAGEPFCQFFVFSLPDLEDVEPQIGRMSDQADLMQQYAEWTVARATAPRADWQPLLYNRGLLPNGGLAPSSHRARLDIAPFNQP